MREAGAEVLLVSFEPLERVAWYLGDVEFGWPVLSDEARASYSAYRLDRGSLFRTWLSPRTLWFYLGEALRGRRPTFDGDLRQLGGDFVIDAAGVVRFAHRSSEPADRPTVDILLSVLHSINRGGGP